MADEERLAAQRAAEATARDRDRLFHRIVETTTEGVWVIDADGCTRYVNPRMASLLGRRPEDILGQPFSDLTGGAAMAQWDRRKQGIADQHEFLITRPDGSATWTLINANPIFDEAGHFAGSLSMVTDIAERKRAEAALRESEGRFRQIADSVPGILWLTDSDGRLTFLSKTFEEYSKQPAERFYGQTSTNNAHPEDGRAASEQWETAMRERRPLSYEYRVQRHDGVYRWHLDTCLPRFDDQGRFLGYIGMLTDVEDRRTLTEQLHQAQKMQAVGQLTGGVAHDFNNLLTVILGNVEMLTEKLTDPQLLRLAEATQNAAERSAALVQRLLAFSRRQALQPTQIDVNELVRGMQDLLLRTLGEDIDIDFSCAPGLWQATADRAQLEAALLNLAVNARDAMPGGGRLTIETANVQIDDAYAAAEPDVVPGAYVMIAVGDSGSGMTAETRRHAFEPFFTTKEVGKGSGLGLSMVYGFIKQSGGHVALDSEVGRGTTVKMHLPRIDDSVERGTALAPAAAAATGQETILVLEGDERARAHVVEQLGSLGYRVVEAANEPDALALLGRRPDVALLFSDVGMPGGMTGKELADAARRHRPALKVLLTTGATESAIAHHGRLGPGIELLGRPFSRAALAAKVRVVLDSLD